MLTRVVAGLLGAAVLLGGLLVLGRAFNARDDAGIAAPQAGPGQAEPDRGAAHGAAAGRRADPGDPPTSGAHRVAPLSRDRGRVGDDALLHLLELGNVALVYPGARPPAALRRVQDAVAGPFDPGLAEAGQAVALVRDPAVAEVQALAWRHRLRAGGGDEGRLRAFAEAWLGRGAP